MKLLLYQIRIDQVQGIVSHVWISLVPGCVYTYKSIIVSFCPIKKFLLSPRLFLLLLLIPLLLLLLPLYFSSFRLFFFCLSQFQHSSLRPLKSHTVGLLVKTIRTAAAEPPSIRMREHNLHAGHSSRLFDLHYVLYRSRHLEEEEEKKKKYKKNQGFDKRMILKLESAAKRLWAIGDTQEKMKQLLRMGQRRLRNNLSIESYCY